MSYILDALKKSEALRERGTAPGLHARPELAMAAPPQLGPYRLRPILVLLVLIAAAWWGWTVWDTERAVPPVPRAAPSAAVPVPTVHLSAPALPVRQTVQPAPPARRADPMPAASAQSQAEPPLLAELPAALRQQMPALAVTGAVYAVDPTQRLLIVNNQVLSEGAVLDADLRVQEIGVRSSVLVFKGVQFRVSH